MPELPEVEYLTRTLAPKILGATCTAINVIRSDLREPLILDTINANLLNQKISQVFRRSKYILWQTPQGTLLIHLGMSGNVFIHDTPTPQLPHTHVVFTFVLPKRRPIFIHFVDPRRFGLIAAFPGHDLQTQKWFNHLGPEPLAEPNLADHLWNISRGKKQPVKSFIMDASNVVGVGNIYASEALFLAKIRPSRRAGAVTKKECEDLASAIKETLDQAIEQGGTTFRDYRHADGASGNNALRLKVYSRSEEPCTVCKSPIKSRRDSGRATYFCAFCQS